MVAASTASNSSAAVAPLSTLRVLQMTTWNAAKFMNATDAMGSVAAGKEKAAATRSAR